MKQLLFLSCLITTLLCVVNGSVVRRSEEEEDAGIIPDYHIAKNIKYGLSDANKLDVYYENNTLNYLKPVVIYIHGGYWCEGDKDEDVAIGMRIQTENYIAVVPNYRLYPEVTNIDDMVEDIYDIILWTKENIKSYGGDANEMTLAGFNAGAHLASLTLIKSALKMEVNGRKLSKKVLFKHLLLLNSPFSFVNDERLEYDIVTMKESAELSPDLAYLEKFAEAKEGLFLGKTGYDEVKILEELDDLSIYSIGTEKITFIECDGDDNYPIGSSQEMMDEVKRVIDDIEIVKQVFPGKYDQVINGVKTSDEEMTKAFMNLVRSPYEICF